MRINKRNSQSQVIVAVLLVLIAIASVVFVGSLVIKQVKQNTLSGEEKLQCLEVDLELTSVKLNSASNTLGITVSRGSSDLALKEVRIYANDKLLLNSAIFANLKSMEMATEIIDSTNLEIKAGDKVELAPVLESGKVCTKSETRSVVAYSGVLSGSGGSGGSNPVPTCSNGNKDADETDIDCGGVCTQDCDIGEKCLVSGDCQSSYCDSSILVCIPSPLLVSGNILPLSAKGRYDFDGLFNNVNSYKYFDSQEEITWYLVYLEECWYLGLTKDINFLHNDIEWVGGCYGASVEGDYIPGPNTGAIGTAIVSKYVPTCSDNIKNQDETDVDCGGSCSKNCSMGQSCKISTDCTSQYCSSGLICAEKPELIVTGSSLYPPDVAGGYVPTGEYIDDLKIYTKDDFLLKWFIIDGANCWYITQDKSYPTDSPYYWMGPCETTAENVVGVYAGPGEGELGNPIVQYA